MEATIWIQDYLISLFRAEDINFQLERGEIPKFLKLSYKAKKISEIFFIYIGWNATPYSWTKLYEIILKNE